MRIVKVLLKISFIFPGSAFLLYSVGPRPVPANLVPAIHKKNMADLNSRLAYESSSVLIKPNNQAEVFWVDTPGMKTEYALVYLHGFSASKGEGDPIHLEFAQRYGMNAYLARLDQHGLKEEDALLALTPENLLESAKEAIAFGKLIGDRVLVMSCSTGSTLAIYLAAENPDWIDALICYSPNIDTYNQATHLLDGPWGLQIIRMVEGGKYHSWEADPEVQKYWSTSYRNEALIDLRQLLDATMTREVFHKVKQPILLLYYYKSEQDQDHTVSVPAMLEMFEELGTDVDLKIKVALPNAGHHVLASKYHSKDLESVRKYTYDFAENVLKLDPISGKVLDKFK